MEAVNTVLTLSNLLTEADALQRRLEHVFRARTPHTKLSEIGKIESEYLMWYEACLAILSPDLKERFVQLYRPGSTERPTVYDFFVQVHEAQEQNPGDDAAVAIPWRLYHYGFLESLEQQRELVFFARRRIWTGLSKLPKGMATAIATICKQAYKVFTIEDLFVRSGCEPHWQVPPFKPDPDSERMNEVFGWLDGILVHAPAQELEIVRTVCETVMAKPRLPEQARKELEAWLEQLQGTNTPARNFLDEYDVHPTVRRVAGPLVAGGHFNQALLHTCIALNEAVQLAAHQPTLDGTGLMQRVF